MNGSKFTNKKLISETENRDIQISLTERDRHSQSWLNRQLHSKKKNQKKKNKVINSVRVCIYNQN